MELSLRFIQRTSCARPIAARLHDAGLGEQRFAEPGARGQIHAKRLTLVTAAAGVSRRPVDAWELCQDLADLFHESATRSNGDVFQIE